MNTEMSENTRVEVLAKKRLRYARAGKEHKSKIITELVELFGYHPKSAIRALQPRVVRIAPFVRGRPKEYDPDKLLPPLKAIWLAALQPCGERLKACLPEWLPAYEQDQRRLAADVRESLLAASRATLDRLLIPARVTHHRRATTRPGSLLRAQDSDPHRVDGKRARLSGVGHGGVMRWRVGRPAWLDVFGGGHSHHLECAARPAQPQRSQCLRANE